ncbi:MAG: DUF1285 domain-containing protein [Geminicoccaceae bacterium]|nr:DUF1285 domain-containing protein [Geminicoccaceae bacterium]
MDTPSDQAPRDASAAVEETALEGGVGEGLRIRADGSWSYQGTPIKRIALVKLFRTVLRREDDRFWLVTPVERVEIEVEDAPFVAVEMVVEGEGDERRLRLRTNLDEWVEVGPEHPLSMRPPRHPDVGEAELVPYVLVADGLEARLLRSVYYELAELGEERTVDGWTSFGVSSHGRFFVLDRPG